MAYGYPIESEGYTTAYGTRVGLRDCLGCTAYDAGFTKELLLGTSDPDMNSLPLGAGWLSNADLLCVIDDIYTFDVIEAELRPAGTFCGGVTSTWAVLIAAVLAVSATIVQLLARVSRRLPGVCEPRLLVLASALSAAVMSLTAKAIAAQGVPTPTVAAACGSVAATLFVALNRVEKGRIGGVTELDAVELGAEEDARSASLQPPVQLLPLLSQVRPDPSACMNRHITHESAHTPSQAMP